MAKILFLHGLEAKPGGRKPTYLVSQGHEVLNPALPDHDFPESIAIAQAELDRHRPEIIVGSSRGGAVALGINAGQVPIVAIAPAWKFCGVAPIPSGVLYVLHSPNDALIPIEHSRELLSLWPDEMIRLLEVGEDHGMFDAEALAALNSVIDELTRPRSQ